MPITVLQVIPNLGAGGAEQACVDMVAGLTKRGDKAIVVTTGGGRVGEIRKHGGICYIRNVASKNPFVIATNAVFLTRMIHESSVDIVHVRSRAPAWSVWAACRKTGCHFVSTFHAAYKFSNPIKKFYNRVMARADRVIAISHFIADHIRENYGLDDNVIRVVRRGIDLARFHYPEVSDSRCSTLRQTWKIPPDRRVILLPARLSPIKGQALAIRAMAVLPPELNVILVILGDDQGRTNYRRTLEVLVEALGVRDRVAFVAHCNDMPAAYKLADLVLAPSFVPEGFGRVPVEAMAMGVPVIASELGATQETVVNGETGWLLPPEDPALWAKTMAKAMSMPVEQRDAMAQKARQRAETLFDGRAMVLDTLKVYDELVN